MDNTFYRQIHNNNILMNTEVAIAVLLLIGAVAFLIYTEVNEK